MRSHKLRLPRALAAISLVTAVFVFTAAPAPAATILDAAYGTPLDAESAKSAAMGSVGASLFTGAAALVHNPALLATAGGGFTVDLNLGMMQVNEDRFAPLFDSFESFTNETAVAISRNTYAAFNGGLLYRLPGETPMTFGVGVFERYSFDYDFFMEVRDPSPFSPVRDVILRFNEMGMEGRLRSATVGYGMQIIPDANIGLSLHRYFGTLNNSARIAPGPGQSGDPIVADFEHDLSGWGWSIGGQVVLSPRAELGVSFESPFTVEGAITGLDSIGTWVPFDSDLGSTGADLSGDVAMDYPGTVRAGLTYYPQNELRTIFVVEAVRRFWESVDPSYRVGSFIPTGTLRDTWDFRVGVEHVFYNGLPVRFGFRYLENYADEESARSIFSAGIGREVAGYSLDVTGQYHRQTSRQEYIFDPTIVSEGTTFPSPDSLSKVEDSVVRLMVGVSRRF